MTAAVVVIGVSGVGVKSTAVAAARWAVPLDSAPSQLDRLARVCGGTVDTVNVGSRAPECPLLILCCVRGGPLSYKASTPDQDAELDWFSNPGDLSKRKIDHIPNSCPGLLPPLLCCQWSKFGPLRSLMDFFGW
jgi:hypothetical protein